MAHCRVWSRLAGVSVLIACLAAPAAAQEAGVRKLEDYREVSPYYEIPSLTSGLLTVTPETELDLGILRLHGFLGEMIRFDDNVYLADRDEKSDLSFSTTPGILGEMFVDDHRLRLSYAPTMVNYAEEKELDTWDHDLDLDLRLDFLDAYVRLSDSLVESQSTRDINFRGRVQSTRNRLGFEAGALVGDYGLGVRGEWQARTYGRQIPSWEDQDEYTFGLFGRWAGYVDQAFLVEYEFLRRAFRGTVLNDSTAHTLRVGMEARPYDDLSYFLKLGVVALDADHDAPVGDDSDLTGLDAEFELRLRLREDLEARVWYVQRPEYASFSNFQEVYRGGVSAHLALDPGWLAARGILYYERARPSNEPNLELFGWGVALTTDLNRWLKVEIGYEGRHRSGRGSLDYRVNEFYIQAIIYF